MKDELRILKSGMYWRTLDGENKDLITECTSEEFKDFMREKGMNIDVIRDSTLDGTGGYHPFGDVDEDFKLIIRHAFLLDLQQQGVTIVKHKDEYQAFLKTLNEKMVERWG